MAEIIKIKIEPSCLLTVPLQTYDNNFSFIVNGEEFKTSRLISDLLSPVICKIHSNDPTVDTFTINTSQSGDFSHILNIFNFTENGIPISEVPFIREVIKILGNDSIECQENSEITVENVLSFIKQHEQNSNFFNKRLSKEIDFTSQHFFELCKTQEEEIMNLSMNTLIRILNNDNLQLNTEDQLLTFINNLYKSDTKYSILYETVLFENVSSDIMKEFTAIYDNEEMSRGTWLRLSKRLESKIEKKSENSEELKRYKIEKKNGILFSPSSNQNEFKGIINYLQTQTNGQIEKEINITASSVWNKTEERQPKVVVLFNDINSYFISKNKPNSWICYDFKKYRIIPTEYTIRSKPLGENSGHPRNWVIECSNDNNLWEIVDEQKNCSILNGKSITATFKMNHSIEKEFQYIRMRLTGPNWNNDDYLQINALEIYGQLI